MTTPADCELPDSSIDLKADPQEVAEAAGLLYTSDRTPGIRRVRSGKGFSYKRPDGSRATGKERDRIAALVIPPAWTDVWICPSARGHIQATGRDVKGRKQYRGRGRRHRHGHVERRQRLPAVTRCG